MVGYSCTVYQVGFGAIMFLFVCSFLYLPIVEVIIAEAALC